MYFLEFGLLMPVFSSYSAQLSSIIVLSLLHYIMMHMYQLSFILVDWLWPIFVGSEEWNQWFTSLCSHAKCCACNLEYCCHLILSESDSTSSMNYSVWQENAAEKCGCPGQSQQRNLSGCSCINKSKDKKAYIFCFQFSNAWARNVLEAFILDWFVMCHMDNPEKNLMLVNHLHLHLGMLSQSFRKHSQSKNFTESCFHSYSFSGLSALWYENSLSVSVPFFLQVLEYTFYSVFFLWD